MLFGVTIDGRWVADDDRDRRFRDLRLALIDLLSLAAVAALDLFRVTSRVRQGCLHESGSWACPDRRLDLHRSPLI